MTGRHDSEEIFRRYWEAHVIAVNCRATGWGEVRATRRETRLRRLYERAYELEASMSDNLEVEQFYVAGGMETYGGGFVKLLGAALRKADLSNARRIKQAFPDYWREYLEVGEELSKEGRL